MTNLRKRVSPRAKFAICQGFNLELSQFWNSILSPLRNSAFCHTQFAAKSLGSVEMFDHFFDIHAHKSSKLDLLCQAY